MIADNLVLSIQVAIMLIVANGMPIIAAKILKNTWQAPIDGGRIHRDDRRWLGDSKTWRGVAASLLGSTLIAITYGWSWWIGAMIAVAAMSGDLVSSFIKRRWGLAPSERYRGLDQLPEAILPALVLQLYLQPSWIPLTIGVVLFVGVDIFISPLLQKIGIRKRPY